MKEILKNQTIKIRAATAQKCFFVTDSLNKKDTILIESKNALGYEYFRVQLIYIR